ALRCWADARVCEMLMLAGATNGAAIATARPVRLAISLNRIWVLQFWTNVIRQVVAGRARARARTTDATKRMIAAPAENCHPTLDSGAGLYGLAGEAVGGFVQTDAGV